MFAEYVLLVPASIISTGAARTGVGERSTAAYCRQPDAASKPANPSSVAARFILFSLSRSFLAHRLLELCLGRPERRHRLAVIRVSVLYAGLLFQDIVQ